MIVNDQSLWERQLVVLALICGFCQLVLAPHVVIGGGHVNFCLVFAVILSLSGGDAISTMIASFIAGLFFDLTATTPVGLMASELTVVAFLFTLDGRDRIMESPVHAFRDACGAVFALEALYLLTLAMVGLTGPFVDVVFLRWLPAAFLDCLALLPFVFALSRPRMEKLSIGRRLGNKRVRGAKGHRYKL